MYKHVSSEKPCDRRLRSSTKLLSLVCVIGLLCSSFSGLSFVHAAGSYYVTLTQRHFGIQFLHVSADNLRDPQHAVFTLTNGAAIWYGIEEQSQPSGLLAEAANPNDNLATATSIMNGVLPPSDIIPINADGTFFQNAKLAVSFSGPNQSIQLTLNPFNVSAGALDIIGLLLQLLGESNQGVQVGMLEAGHLTHILTDIQHIQHIVDFISHFISMLQAVPNTINIIKQANTCVSALLGLFADKSEVELLANVLALAVGYMIPGIAATLASFATGIGEFLIVTKLVKFLADFALSLGSYLFQQDSLPTLILQTNSSATPTGTPTLSPTATSSLTVTPTTTSILSPTPTPILLNVNPNSINASQDCSWQYDSMNGQHGGGTWSCAVSLQSPTGAQQSLPWSVSSSGLTSTNSMVSFSQSSGLLAPGQSIIVNFKVSVIYGGSCLSIYQGKFIFSGPFNTVNVPWTCHTPTFTITPIKLTVQNDCQLLSTGEWDCIVTAAQNFPGQVLIAAGSNNGNITIDPGLMLTSPGASMTGQLNIYLPTTSCPGTYSLNYSASTADSSNITGSITC